MDEAQILIQTTDGRRWPVHGEGSHRKPIRLMEGSLGEFYDTPISTTYRDRTGVGGSAFMGSRDLARRWTLRLDAFGPEWDMHMSQMLRGLSEWEDALVIHRTQRWGERVLPFRKEEAPKYRRNVDPYGLESTSYEIPVISGDPYWREHVPQSDEFEFTGDGLMGTLRVENPGTVECWPEWVLTSPAAWVVGDGPGRMVPLRFQPEGRDVHLMSSPVKELSESMDRTLDHWMGGGPVHFLNPVPPVSDRVDIPVGLDPMPGLTFRLANEWKVHVLREVDAWARGMGRSEFLNLSAEQVGERCAQVLRGPRPAGAAAISPGVLAGLTASHIGGLIRSNYGSFRQVLGATAQIVMERRYHSPWG